MAVSQSMLATAKALELDRLATEVISHLRGADVPTLLLKGAAIADVLYADGALRAYGDVDVLIPRAELARAASALKDGGFTPRLRQGDVPEELHAEEWLDPSRRWTLDLHTDLPGVPAGGEDLWPTLWVARAQLRLAGTDVDVLGPAATALHVALHAAHHGREVGRPVEDLRRALQHFELAAWHEAAELAWATGAQDSFVAGLLLTDAGRTLVAAEGWVTPMRTQVKLRAASAPAAAVALDRMLEAGSLPAAGRMLLHELVPSAAFLRHSLPLARRGRRGLAAAYAVRPVLLLVRVGPAIRALRAARRA